MDIRKWNKAFIVLSLVFFIVRIIFILNMQPYLDSDPALVATMAKHIVDGKSLPVYLYGQHYNGGATIFVYLLASFYVIFGVNPVLHLILNLFLSYFIMVAFYYLCRKHFNNFTSIFTSLFIAIAPPAFLKVNVLAGDYTFSMILLPLAVLFFYDIFYEKKARPYHLALLGLFMALSYMILEFIVPLAAILILFWYIFDKRFFIRNNFFIFVGSFLIGLIPLIIYNIMNNFANLKQLLAGSFIHRFVCEHNILPRTMQFGDRLVDHCSIFTSSDPYLNAGLTLKHYLGFIIPSLFGSGFMGYIYVIIFFLLVYLIWVKRKNFALFFQSLIPLKRYDIKPIRMPKEIMIVILVLFWFVVNYLTGFPGRDHLLPILGFLYMSLSFASIELINRWKKAGKIFVAVFILVLIVITIVNASNWLEDNRSKSFDQDSVIGFLEDNDLWFVYSDYNTKWGIILATKEKIIVSCQDLCPCGYRYKPYEDAVSDADRFAYVLNVNSTIFREFDAYLTENNIEHLRKQIDNKIIIYDMDIRPEDFMDGCIYSDGFE